MFSFRAAGRDHHMNEGSLTLRRHGKTFVSSSVSACPCPDCTEGWIVYRANSWATQGCGPTRSTRLTVSSSEPVVTAERTLPD